MPRDRVEYMRAYRERNRHKRREWNNAWFKEHGHEYRQRTAPKIAARYELNKAVKRGEIERQPCEECGTTEQVQAHHEDYDKPLDVRWLCRTHHTEVHLETQLS